MPKDSYVPQIDFKGSSEGSIFEEVNTGPPPKLHQAGRVCKKDGCNTPLTSYNPNDHCYTHQREIDRAKAMNAPRNKKKAS